MPERLFFCSFVSTKGSKYNSKELWEQYDLNATQDIPIMIELNKRIYKIIIMLTYSKQSGIYIMAQYSEGKNRC